MKKHTFSCLLLICALLFHGCSFLQTPPPEHIDSYDYAIYDDFTSHTISDEGDKIYIQGKLLKSYVQEFDGAPFIVAKIQESKNKEWTYRIGPMGLYSDELLSDHIGENVRCFGHFYKMIEGQPVVDSEWDEITNLNSSCIQFYKDSEDAEKLENFLSTDQYVSHYVDSNIEDTPFYENQNKAGTYKITGIFDYYSKDTNYFDFYEETPDGYKSQMIDGISAFDSLSATRNKEIIKDIKNTCKIGYGITIYYIIDDEGYTYLFGYKSSSIHYDIEKIKAEASPTTLFAKKEYDLDDYGTINFELHIRKSDSLPILHISIYANTVENAINIFSVVYHIFDKVGNYNISVYVNNLNVYAFFSNIEGELYASGIAPDGSLSVSWVDINKCSTEDFTAIDALLTPIIEDFLEEVKNNNN